MNGLKKHRVIKVTPLRRVVQLVVFGVIILTAYVTANPFEWSPSRIVLGHLPPPSVLPVSGDTWVYTIGGFRLVHPMALIDGIFAMKVFYIPLLIGVVIPLITTILLGRVFCSWLCPFGFLLELNQKAHNSLKMVGLKREIKIPDIRNLFLIIILTLSFFLYTPVLSAIDPPHMLGREFMYLFTHHSLSVTGLSILLGIILFEGLFSQRGWCGSLCPAGGGLSLLGAKRVLRIELDSELCTECSKCNEVCPYSLAPMRLKEDTSNFDWTKCDNCGLCRDVCPTGAIRYKLKGR